MFFSWKLALFNSFIVYVVVSGEIRDITFEISVFVCVYIYIYIYIYIYCNCVLHASLNSDYEIVEQKSSCVD